MRLVGSSGWGLVGGKFSSSSVMSELSWRPCVSSIDSGMYWSRILRQVRICVLKERWHTSSLCIRKFWCLTLIHQAITCIQPKFFVQIFIRVRCTKWLHYPVDSCFTQFIKRRTDVKPQLTSNKAIGSNMNLFVTTYIGRYCT